MDLSLRALGEVVRQELGRPPSRSTAETLINEAGVRWDNAHTWGYQRQRTLKVQLQPGVESYRLGAGVYAVGRVLHRPDTIWAPLPLVDFDAYTREKERYLAGIERPFHPLVTQTWDVREGDDRRYLYLHFFPTTLSEELTVEYVGSWVPLNEQDDTADIPLPLASHFVDWLRFYARTREFPENYPPGSLDQYKRTAAFMDAKTADALNNGRIVARQGRTGDYYQNMRQGRVPRVYDALRRYYERGFPE